MRDSRHYCCEWFPCITRKVLALAIVDAGLDLPRLPLRIHSALVISEMRAAAAVDRA
jgi:hypothetical protein